MRVSVGRLSCIGGTRWLSSGHIGTNQLDRFVDTLTPDAELVSTLLARGVIRGKNDLGLRLGAVYGSLSELRCTEEIKDGNRGFMVAEARVGPSGLKTWCSSLILTGGSSD